MTDRALPRNCIVPIRSAESSAFLYARAKPLYDNRAARRRAAVVEAELVAGARQGQGRGGEREA